MPADFPSIETLLVSGGDERIACDAQGRNKNGCTPVPDPAMLGFSSSTASSISNAAFAACQQLYARLAAAHQKGQGEVFYIKEMHRIRHELTALCGLESLAGLEVVLGTSGTDLHQIAGALLGAQYASLRVIMPQESETGSGVKAALQEKDCADVVAVACRMEDGTLRPGNLVDAEVESFATQAVAAGKHVLIIIADVSKTGLVTPSPEYAVALQKRFPDKIDILVDGCQFRLAKATIRHYLQQHCMLAITGSKFVTGPAFSAALFIAEKMAQRFPIKLIPDTNYGLLLRFEAALTELRAFHALPEKQVLEFLKTFAAAVQNYFASSSVFEPLIGRAITRATSSWDSLPTIFPFLLRHKKTGALFNHEEAKKLHTLLQSDLSQHPAIPAGMQNLASKRCLLGQTVTYKNNISALRLNMDMRLIADAVSHRGRGADAVIQDALTVLGKTALIAEYLF